jgi:hypothetical protein
VSNQEHRLKVIRDSDLPQPAVHSPTCLCGCALATYSMDATADAPPPAPELRERAA